MSLPIPIPIPIPIKETKEQLKVRLQEASDELLSLKLENARLSDELKMASEMSSKVKGAGAGVSGAKVRVVRSPEELLKAKEEKAARALERAEKAAFNLEKAKLNASKPRATRKKKETPATETETETETEPSTTKTNCHYIDENGNIVEEDEFEEYESDMLFLRDDANNVYSVDEHILIGKWNESEKKINHL
jgi:hypothetical protein